MKEAAAALSRFPERGPLVPELLAQGISLYRELVVAPWRIVYRVSGSTVFVLLVMDARRNVEDVLLGRLLK
ncbi:MAG: type II toxin-antitoxin system RelE/ParE family toxin [Thermodesulfobacteriota bacterium]